MKPETKVIICCVATWVNSVAGCAIGIATRQWEVAAWAFNAAFCAAGWWVSTKHWAAWKQVAHEAVEALERRQ